MKCKRCRGQVFLDRAESTEDFVELSCLRCGKRWELKSAVNRFAYWVIRQERYRQREANGLGG
jgi:hypothetical protein